MASATDTLETKILNHIFRSTAFAKVGTLYISLHTAGPTESTVGTEVAGGAYARSAVVSSDANWTLGVAGSATTVTNAVELFFPRPTVNWGVVSGYGVFDAATGGNLLLYGTLGAARTISANDSVPSFAPGALIFSLD